MAVRGARRSLVLLLALAAVLALTLACTGSGEDDRVAAPAPPTASATAAESATPAPVATPTRAATAAPTPAPAVTPTATVVALPAPTPTATATRTPTAALPADRCATPTDADCIRAVYLGAPGDYAQVADIPADTLLTPDADGRYQVERGQQYTVVTAAPLPAGWTRFWLERTPSGSPPAVSASQLIAPVGTTYTFTVTADEAASTLITFDLKAARPFIRPRPDGKPELGAAVVTTVFSVETTSPRYNAYDTTGAVATAGSYAFLDDPADTASAVTTYEALRDGTTTALLIHKSDAHGASQAEIYDAAEAGDLFEWHEADDCFVRYKVTEVKPDPAGAVPRKLLAVEWMTYAYTGCSGAISADAEVGMTSGNMLDLGGVGLRAPVVHGTHHLVPSTWEGETEATTHHEPDTPPKQEETGASTLAEVRALHLPYWREPTLPEGWILDRAWEGGLHAPWEGFCSVYLTEPLQFPDGRERQKGIEVCGAYNTVRKFAQNASFYADQGASPDGLIVRETRVIAGRPAVILWSPPGPNYLWNADVRIYIDDPKTETSYSITVAAPHRSDLAADGNAKLEKAIALATSLFESEAE